jgi:hypothetical protein
MVGSDRERIKPTFDARGERVIDAQIADEESGYGIDPTTNELFAWADSGMIVLSIDPAEMLVLAMRALPEGHPLKIDWYEDVEKLDYFVRSSLDAAKELADSSHRSKPDWVVEEEKAEWDKSAAPVNALIEKLRKLAPAPE